MNKNLKKYSSIFVLVIFLLFQKTKVALAEIYIPTSEETGLPNAPLIDIVTKLMQNIIITFGFIAIICFVIAGIYYLTSAGDEETAKRGKKAMLYSIIGVVVALSSFVVIKAIDAILRAQSF